jgi:hypothetical protein
MIVFVLVANTVIRQHENVSKSSAIVVKPQNIQ